jgi:hypothetical protein
MKRKRMSDSPRAVEMFIKAGLIIAVAAVLLMPTSIKVSGEELMRGSSGPAVKQASWPSLPLPPIPHLATMSWLGREPVAKPMKIDTLLAPKFELFGPAAAETVGDDRAPSVLRGLPSTSALEASRHG